MTAPFLEILAAALPDLRLTTDALDLEAHRRDETAYLEPPLPLAVAFPASTAEVAGIVRLAAAHRVPLVPRGAGTSLSGGAIAVAGGLTVSLDADEPGPRDRRGEPGRRRPAGRRQRRPQDGGGGPRPLLRAGSRELRDVHDRRQPGHELRRPLLREVRRDARRGPRPRGGPGRRRRHPDRRPQREGRRGLRPGRPLRREHGHAGDRHRGDPAPHPDAGPQADAARVLPDDRGVGRGRRRDGPRRGAAVHARADGRLHDPRRQRGLHAGPRRDRRRDAPRRVGPARGRGGRGAGPRRAGLRGGRGRASSSGPRTRPRRTCSARAAGWPTGRSTRWA